jgi:hypothetical protein
MAADALYVINHYSRITRVNPWVYSIAFGDERAKKGRRAGKQDGRRARFFWLFVITCTCSGSCNTQESKIIASTGDIDVYTYANTTVFPGLLVGVEIGRCRSFHIFGCRQSWCQIMEYVCERETKTG